MEPHRAGCADVTRVDGEEDDGAGYVDRVALERMVRLRAPAAAATADGSGGSGSGSGIHAALLRRVSEALNRVLERSASNAAAAASSRGGGGPSRHGSGGSVVGGRRDGGESRRRGGGGGSGMAAPPLQRSATSSSPIVIDGGGGRWGHHPHAQHAQQQRRPSDVHPPRGSQQRGGSGGWTSASSAPPSVRPDRLLRLCRPLDDALCAGLLGVLNKLTESNYGALRDKVVAMFRDGAAEADAIGRGVELVLDKAAQDRSFGVTYARLLADVSQAVDAARMALETRLATACARLTSDVDAASRLLHETDAHGAEVADQASALYDVFCQATRARTQLLNRHRMLVRLTFSSGAGGGASRPTVTDPTPETHAAWLVDGMTEALERVDEKGAGADHALHMWVDMADAVLAGGAAGGRSAPAALSPGAQAGLRALLRDVCSRGPQRIRFRAMDVLQIRPTASSSSSAQTGPSTGHRGGGRATTAPSPTQRTPSTTATTSPSPIAAAAAAAATMPNRRGGAAPPPVPHAPRHRHHYASAMPGRAPW